MSVIASIQFWIAQDPAEDLESALRKDDEIAVAAQGKGGPLELITYLQTCSSRRDPLVMF